jgi:uncharacterized protein (TIGR02284 family)
MLNQSHDISVLNSLIETTIDSIDGYQHSASEATNSRFAQAFRDRASEREQIVQKLRDRVRSLGGTPESDGGILAAMHRQFVSLRDAVTGKDDNSIVAEVDRGESYLDGKWQAALKDNELSDETLQLIRTCYESVQEGHRQWEAVNKGMSAAG